MAELEIVAFLEARFTEDAKAWKTLWLKRQGNKRITGGWDGWGDVGYAVSDILDTTRGGREIAAKRQLIDFAFKYAADIDGEYGDGHTAEEIRAGECDDTFGQVYMDVLRLLAAPYADHKDFAPAWSVTR